MRGLNKYMQSLTLFPMDNFSINLSKEQEVVVQMKQSLIEGLKSAGFTSVYLNNNQIESDQGIIGLSTQKDEEGNIYLILHDTRHLNISNIDVDQLGISFYNIGVVDSDYVFQDDWGDN
jgi:hypothetical protein